VSVAREGLPGAPGGATDAAPARHADEADLDRSRRPSGEPDLIERRVRGVVAEVLREALRARGARGVVVTGPTGPERALLLRWLTAEGLEVAEPDPARVEAVARALAGGTGEPDEDARGFALGAVARHLAHPDHLVLSPQTRTHLLLEGAAAGILPLGDLYASTVAVWARGVSLPATLAGRSERLAPVDRALAAFLEGGRPLAEALDPLPVALRPLVERALRHGSSRTRPPLVPKLGPWTPGIDPPL
jgi:hypothetical protein